ncbi:hypothetical protein B8V81_1451 [Paenibacillus pasadenensis]|uniref:Uncharacterized protein n=1 Tax=Paenibacillus pasadenensis TaxID=217090 RepID=A0A2N5NA44_9BACL|nr:hypothetical protein B8V81_1451 [Paenibacillus pasadenensis]
MVHRPEASFSRRIRWIAVPSIVAQGASASQSPPVRKGWRPLGGNRFHPSRTGKIRLYISSGVWVYY